MEVNRNNYEAFLLDYIEGTLSPDRIPALLAFLRDNPDIAEESKDLLDNVLVAEPTIFDDKISLKKNLHSDIPGISKFEQLSISLLEKDISEEQNALLNETISQNQSKRKEHQLIQKTRLVPDASIHFPNKNKLKHSPAKVILLKRRIYFAAAACILAILGFVTFLRTDKPDYQGTALSYQKIEILKRRIDLKEESNTLFIPDKKDLNIVIVKQDTLENRIAQNLETLSSKQLLQISDVSESKLNALNEMAYMLQSYQKEDDEGFQSIQEYLKAKFKEKVLKQEKNEKTTLISIANAVGRGINKVFHKNIKVEKTETKDGGLLYAIKTDSFDFYSKIKPRGKKDAVDKTNERKN